MMKVMVVVTIMMTMPMVMLVIMSGGESRIVSLCDVAATALRKVPAVS